MPSLLKRFPAHIEPLEAAVQLAIRWSLFCRLLCRETPHPLSLAAFVCAQNSLEFMIGRSFSFAISFPQLEHFFDFVGLLDSPNPCSEKISFLSFNHGHILDPCYHIAW